MQLRACLLPVLLLPFLGACQQDSPGSGQLAEAESLNATITGTVSYRERIALSPQAILSIALQDVSRADAKAITLARTELSEAGQVPIAFELDFDPANIDERMTYVIRAEIRDRGGLMFTTDTHTPVLTRGAGTHVDMTLVRVNRPTVSPPEAPPATLGMELEGMFLYFADAALFRDCRSNKTFPVSMEGAYIEVERAYLESGVEGGTEVLVRLNGRFLERPPMEGEHDVVKLVVDSFHELVPGEECSPETHADLLNVRWKLLEVDGKDVTTAKGHTGAHLIFSSAESRIHGNAGCNNFFGQYQVDGEQLVISGVGSTMMACPDGMDTEQAFLSALGKANRFSISGLILELYHDDELLARLEAVYL